MISTVDVVLTGARAGKSCKCGYHQFVDGVLRLRGSREQLEPVLALLGRAYAAFPHGSKELIAAQAADQERIHGKHPLNAEREPGSSNELLGAKPDAVAGGAKAGEGVQRGGDAGATTGSQGSGTGGDGHEHARLRPGQGSVEQQQNAHGDLIAIRKAVLLLDPTVDDHWTPEGKPAVEAVCSAMENPAISRKEIDAAAADWNRERAVEKKALEGK